MAAPVWTSLTYATLSILTSTKMTQTQDNHRAVAHGVINGGAESGAANAYVVACTGLDALLSGLEIWFIPGNTNTGDCTVNVASTGVKSIVMEDGSTPWPGDVQAGVLCKLVYNAVGGVFQLMNPAGRGISPKGYAMGGYNGASYFASIDGLRFSDETAINPSATLADGARAGSAGVNSANRGYVMGGELNQVGTFYAYIDGLQFSDETAVNPSAVLAEGARCQMAGVNSKTRGYAMGGTDGTTRAWIDGLQFSDEAAINPAATLADGARRLCAGINSAIRGYACGGYNTSSAIDGLQFSDETAINPSAVLADGGRNDATGVNSAIKGYILGGIQTITVKDWIDGLQFSDETAINPSAVLADGAREGAAGVNSTIRGYAMGGTDGNSRTWIDGLQFSDEVAVNPSAVLADARHYTVGVQSGGIL